MLIDWCGYCVVFVLVDVGFVIELVVVVDVWFVFVVVKLVVMCEVVV